MNPCQDPQSLSLVPQFDFRGIIAYRLRYRWKRKQLGMPGSVKKVPEQPRTVDSCGHRIETAGTDKPADVRECRIQTGKNILKIGIRPSAAALLQQFGKEFSGNPL